MPARPLGITLIAVLCFLNVVAYGLFALLSAVSPDRIRTILQGLSPGGIGPTDLLRLGPFLPVYFLAMAILVGLLGRGLWNLKNWARVIVIILGGISLAGIALNLLGATRMFDTVTVASLGIRLAITLLVLWYLTRPHVVSAFKSPAR